jgi:hypothetical protein
VSPRQDIARRPESIPPSRRLESNLRTLVESDFALPEGPELLIRLPFRTFGKGNLAAGNEPRPLTLAEID